MLAANRHQSILENLEQQGAVRTIDLAKQLNVTDETIRRDLEKLEKENLLQRTHGGAVIPSHLNKDRSFAERSIQNIDSKRRIAVEAGKLIQNGDRIFLDSSSTALQLAGAIKAKSDITVITNSSLVIAELAPYSDVELILAGGVFDRQSQSYIGPATLSTLQRYRIDKSFFSANGIDEFRGISEINEAQAHIKDFVIPRSDQAVLLADPTKLGVSSTYFFAQCEELDAIVTCAEGASPLLDNLEQKGVRVIYAS